MATTPVLIQACLNGSRALGAHPALPVRPDELALAARAAVAAGAGALHIHPRGRDGEQSMLASDVGAALAAVRAACPGVPVGTTTLLRVAGGRQQRLELVRSWQELPDYTSVNWFEEGADKLAELLLSRGVGIEAGLAGVTDAAAFIEGPVASRCLRLLVEVREREGAGAVGLAERIDAVLDHAGSRTPRLHHGFGAETWKVLAAGFDKGRDVRVGLEDVLSLPDGSDAPDNAALVRAAVVLAREHGREPSPAG
jgi:uncharacterized protein (DUF849 family)